MSDLSELVLGLVVLNHIVESYSFAPILSYARVVFTRFPNLLLSPSRCTFHASSL
jgi:hypothetical protein